MKKQNIWLAGAGAVLATAAGLFLINRRRRQAGSEKPPRNAPQLRIQNPGDQSDFRTAPSESGLG